MSTTLRRLLWLAVIAAVIAAVVWWAGRPRPVAVALIGVQTGSVRQVVANTRAGTVKACRRARLSPPIGGQIAVLAVTEGDEVDPGELLLSLWNEDLAAELTLAERDAVAAEARADETCIAADVARREAERIRRLRREGLASEEDADRTDGDERARRAGCTAARATARVANARLLRAQALFARTLLRAPFAGTVAEINGEVGEFVTPSPVGIVTPPAVDLVDTSCLYITAPIDEVDAPAIRRGMPAVITLDAFPDRRFPGTVRRVAPYVLDLEKQARTVEIEAEIDEPADNLLPGYSADVEVVLAVRDDVLRVPTQAVLSDDSVLLYRPDSGTLEQREIVVGLSNWEQTEIVEGLAAGDRVVLSVDREGVAPGVAVVPE